MRMIDIRRRSDHGQCAIHELLSGPEKPPWHAYGCMPLRFHYMLHIDTVKIFCERDATITLNINDGDSISFLYQRPGFAQHPDINTRHLPDMHAHIDGGWHIDDIFVYPSITMRPYFHDLALSSMFHYSPLTLIGVVAPRRASSPGRDRIGRRPLYRRCASGRNQGPCFARCFGDIRHWHPE